MSCSTFPSGRPPRCAARQPASSLAGILVDVAAHFGLKARALIGDGTQPVGRGIGPALEARDVLAVLQNAPDAPADLRARAVALAGALLELAGAAADGAGATLAAEALADGRAWAKFQRICEAQGGMRDAAGRGASPYGRGDARRPRRRGRQPAAGQDRQARRRARRQGRGHRGAGAHRRQGRARRSRCLWCTPRRDRSSPMP